MKSSYVTLIKCADAGEAAFYADYLAQHGIPSLNTAEQLKSWSGRYSQMNRKPVIKVQPEHAQQARKLLEELPETNEEEMDALANRQAERWETNSLLHHCPLCGSEHVEAITSGSLPAWILWLCSLGLYKPDGAPMWVCRDCDWDSRRKDPSRD